MGDQKPSNEHDTRIRELFARLTEPQRDELRCKQGFPRNDLEAILSGWGRLKAQWVVDAEALVASKDAGKTSRTTGSR